MSVILITGSSGFLGEEIVNFFSKENLIYALDRDTPIDFQQNPENIKKIICDIGDRDILESIFNENKIDIIIHSAAELLSAKNPKKLWKTNYYGTKNLLDLAKKFSVKKFIFTSTSAIFEKNYDLPINEKEPSSAIDEYGKSKHAAENLILNHAFNGSCIIFRCPLIIGKKRLDKLAILFEMIRNNLNIWIIGNGSNRIQFIYSLDLLIAIQKSIKLEGKHLFNIGSDNVESLNSTFQKVLNHAKSNKKIMKFPKIPGLILLKFLNILGILSFGPYHQRFLISNSVFNTNKIKSSLDWKPTYSNEKMLIECYDNYLKSFLDKKDKSSSKKVTNLKIIRILKFFNL